MRRYYLGTSGARFMTLFRILKLLAALLILKIAAGVVFSYPDYFPPDFGSDFLLGREAHFFGSYQGAFYLHIIAGPLSLVLGLLLMNDRFRRTLPKWHRRLGRIQVLGVLLLVAPS